MSSPSKMTSSAWIRINRGGSNAMGTSFTRICNGDFWNVFGVCEWRNRGRHGPARRSESEIGRLIAFQCQTAPPPPPDRLHPGQPDSARPCIWGPIAFQPSLHEKDRLDPLDTHTERRWYVVGYSERNLHEPKDDLQRIHDNSKI